MQLFNYIQQRMMNMGYIPEDVVIEPIALTMAGNRTQRIEATNVYYYLYDVTEYEHEWTLDCDIEITDNKKFIIDEKIPFGILEVTGNIEITTIGETSAGNTFLFYRATPGRIMNR